MELKISVSFDWSVPAKLFEAEVLECDNLVNFVIVCGLFGLLILMMDFSVPAEILEIDVLVQVL